MENRIKTHKDLDIYKEGINLVSEIYKLTKQLPKEEIYGLSSQMQRASVSFASNIAEGAARGTTNEYVRFLYISLSSLSELETHVMICCKLNYIQNDHALLEDIEKLRRKTLNLIKYMKEVNALKR